MDIHQREAIWQVLDKTLENSREIRDDLIFGGQPMFSDSELIAEAITLIEKILAGQPYIPGR